jgi:hypothetical protein
MNFKNLGKFLFAGLSLSATSSFGQGGRPNFVSTPIAEFAGNYTASFMIDYALKNMGNQPIEPTVLAPQLFDATGQLNSFNVWNSWRTYGALTYYALQASTNGLIPRRPTASGAPPKGDLITTPNDGVAAMVVTSFIALNDMTGKKVRLEYGQLPNFLLYPDPNYNSYANVPEQIRQERNDPNVVNGCFLASSTPDDPLRFAATFAHELNHATSNYLVSQEIGDYREFFC